MADVVLRRFAALFSFLVVSWSSFGCEGPTATSDAVAAGGHSKPPADNGDPHSEVEQKQQSPAVRHPANRLASETSPYLLMHAHNPVDWYPWGDEALAKAKRENKPIFLSIGYSSCYWCHVMERESFLDKTIADYLNEHFVCIKVDREERPDVDEIYMTSVQLMTRRGGWPLSVFLTPDTKPFYGGTYFPPRAFSQILTKIDELWQKEPQELRGVGDRLTTGIREHLRRQSGGSESKIDDSLIDAVTQALAGDYDASFGGFGFETSRPKMPKFPESSKLLFLLDRAEKGNNNAREMLVQTLDRIARGGIYDHLGGGFHRYSTDRYWWVPHFEKMLYDNGQLATVYSGAYQLTGREDFAEVVRGIADFVLREMTDQEGAFYSALDAETHAEEGEFYVWSDAELAASLDKEALEVFRSVYVWPASAIRKTLPPGQAAIFGQFYPSGDTPVFEAGHVLMLARPLAELAKNQQTTVQDLVQRLAPIRARLLAKRGERDRPLTDTKILTAWNGLMIRGLADSGRILKEPKYVNAASRAAEFVLAKLRKADGRLLRTHSKGQAKLNAYLDDYAFFVDGLIALHRANQDPKWLEAADSLTAKQIELFWDQQSGGFFFTSHDHEALIARGKDPIDSAIPSGNSVSVDNLIYLARQLERPSYRNLAQKTLQAVAGRLREYPAAMPRSAVAISAFLEP